MALLLLDDPSLYTTATAPQWWQGGFNGTVVTTPLPPNSQAGAQVIELEGSYAQSDNYGPQSRMICGLRFKLNNSVTGAEPLINFVTDVGAGNQQNNLIIKADSAGTYVVDGQSGATIATGSVIPIGAWTHIEVDIQFSLTSSTVKVYLNGNGTTPFMQATGFALTYATCHILKLGNFSTSGTNCSFFCCDGYLLNGVSQIDSLGRNLGLPLAPQGFGGMKTGYAVPIGAGHITQWTPNGAAANWQCVDQIPQDGDTTYVDSSTVGQIDMYAIGGLPTMGAVLAVQLSICSREDDAGPRSIQTGVSNGTTDGFSGVDLFLGGTYQYFRQEFSSNPVTGNAWVPSDLTTLQIGQKLTT